MYKLDYNQNIAFVADVHLKTDDDPSLEKILIFLDGLKNEEVKHLFILGDFFNFWVNSRFLIQKAYAPVLEKFKDLHQSGIKITYLTGNRDFLITWYYRDRDEVEIFDKPLLGKLGDKTIYLAHGDELCSNDQHYQFYKTIIRNRLLGLLIRSLPGKIKEAIAQHMSKTSRKIIKDKTKETLGVTEPALEKIFDRGVDIVIHGHTHNNYMREVETSGKKKKVFGLGDWSKTGHFLLYNASNRKFIQKQI
ncbi:MAG: UDP-2,3-diacylglucosamine diphosphatase [Candidatus Omnitrophica bacterium]|nr:UDP-2,3-diacylglucosamine diphosphatase [Candidatus Omnitrophota bacterium]